jgi:hypothetical protein
LPSSRSELIEKDIRQKPGSAGLFSFWSCLAPQVVACNAFASVVLLETTFRIETWRTFFANAFALRHRERTAPECQAGVTLKNNLEKLRFANHLPP